MASTPPSHTALGSAYMRSAHFLHDPQQEWACEYRYWEPGDTGRNGKSAGLAIAMYVGLALGVIAVLLMALDQPGVLADGEWMYDCSTG